MVKELEGLPTEDSNFARIWVYLLVAYVYSSGKKNFGSKNFCVRNKFGTPKNVGSKQFLPPPKILFQKKFGSKEFIPKKLLVQNDFWPTKFLRPKKIWGSKNVKILSPKKCGVQKVSSQKIGSKNVRQNLVSNSWDIAYMDKCPLESSYQL